MVVEFAHKTCEIIKSRQGETGGFANKQGGLFRADATCWGILALARSGILAASLERAWDYLERVQHQDGRICVAPQHTDAFWPTPLAILAWHPSGRHRQYQEKAARFLLGFDQMRIVGDADADVIGHDPTIRGWPWVADTAPWLEPTAYCVMALRLAGFQGHTRTLEAQRFLMDRQLPAGGWNVGNTTIYGRELRPMPETTGVALEALAGLVPRQQVEKSIDYLHSQLPCLVTPFSLAWAILGLAAWKEATDNREHISRVVDRQGDDLSWDTVSLSLLLLAWHCEEGLCEWLQQSSSRRRVPTGSN